MQYKKEEGAKGEGEMEGSNRTNGHVQQLAGPHNGKEAIDVVKDA